MISHGKNIKIFFGNSHPALAAFALKCAVLEGIKLTYDVEGIDIAYPHMQVVKSEE